MEGVENDAEKAKETERVKVKVRANTFILVSPGNPHLTMMWITRTWQRIYLLSNARIPYVLDASFMDLNLQNYAKNVATHSTTADLLMLKTRRLIGVDLPTAGQRPPLVRALLGTAKTTNEWEKTFSKSSCPLWVKMRRLMSPRQLLQHGQKLSP